MSKINILKQIYTFLFFPFFVVIILLLPIKLIRFGKLDSSRIGHFTSNTALNILEKKKNNINSIDIYYLDKIVSNTFLLKLWKRKIIILPRILIFPFFNFFISFSYLEKFIAKDNKNSDRDTNKLIEKNKALLEFTKIELENGQLILDKMGIKKNSKIALIYNRDSKYLNVNYSFESSYHDFRNSNIDNYKNTAEALVKKNYYVIRIGKNVQQKFITNNNKIIDYADSIHQSDFMDIYLHYISDFIISNGAGIDELSRIFKKPILKVNFCPYLYIPTYQFNTFVLPKKHYDKKNQKYLSLNELFKIKVAQSFNTKDFIDKNIELLENSPEEILSATIEFIKFMNNDNFMDNENIKFQNKFWNRYYANLKEYDLEYLHCNQDQRLTLISNKFLNENPYLLN